MSLSMHAASVPVFQQMLGGLSDVLAKAAAHAAERNIDPQAYLQSRLFPDMFPLLRQVQIACDFAKSVSARLAQAELPAWEDNEASFEDLQARIARTQDFIAGLDAAAFDGAESREIVLRPGTPKEKRLTGQADLVPLHRIDRETAGLVLFGKAMALRRLFPALRVDYVRVVGTQWVDDPEVRFQSVDIRQPLMLTLLAALLHARQRAGGDTFYRNFELEVFQAFTNRFIGRVIGDGKGADQRNGCGGENLGQTHENS